MEHDSQNSLWNRFFDVDSQTGSAKIIGMIALFAVVGGGISWLVG